MTKKKEEWVAPEILTPTIVNEWDLSELKKQIMLLLGNDRLHKLSAQYLCSAANRDIYNAVLDNAVGQVWENVAGQPAMRVLTRPQLERVYAYAVQLQPLGPAFLAYLLRRSEIMRRNAK